MNHCAYCEYEDNCKDSTTHQWCDHYIRRTMEPRKPDAASKIDPLYQPLPRKDTIGAITIPSHHSIDPEEPMSTAMINKILKYDMGKTMWHLLPLEVIEGIAKVMTFGAEKYSEDGWKDTDLSINRCYSAMMRHYIIMQSGEHLDPESGLPHAYHFATNAIFIAYKNIEGEVNEDR